MKIRNIILGVIFTLLASSSAYANAIAESLSLDWQNSPYSMYYADLSPIGMMGTITNVSSGDILLDIGGASITFGPPMTNYFNFGFTDWQALNGVTLSSGETSAPFQFGLMTPLSIVPIGTYSTIVEELFINSVWVDFNSPFTITATPEPATMLLLGTGLVGVAGAARRRKKNQA